MNVFFNQDGFLNLDEAVMEMDSFKKIMEDGIVTDDEMLEQANRVSTLLHRVEETMNEEQAALVKDVLSEMNVLFAVYHYREIQSLR